MPYVPPHLRPGYVAKTAPAAPSYAGRVHWPTNVNSHRANNVVQPEALHAPSAATAASLADLTGTGVFGALAGATGTGSALALATALAGLGLAVAMPMARKAIWPRR